MKKLFFFLAAMVVAMTANAKVTTISPDAENDALRLAVHYAEDGDIIEMTEGTYVQCNNGYVAFDGKAVTVRAAEGANVVLQPQVRITLANGGKATFENIKIDASRIHELADWYEHVFYVADATEGKQLVLNNCEFYGFDINNSAIYAGSDKKLDLCSLTNCYFHNNDKSCLFFEGESLGELSITNSTFANITAKVTGSYYAGVVDVRNSAAKVTIDHCTFYNCLLMNTDYAAITMKGPQAANVTISNNIFMLPEATDGQRAIRNDVEAKNCMTFNYLKDNGGIHSSVTKTNCQLNVDPKFVDAANGNFALAEGSPALGAGTDGSNLGDPRWNAPAVEEPVYEVMELTMTNLEVMNYGSATGLYASDLDNGIEVMLFLDAEGKLMEEESSIATALGDYTVTGTVAKAYSEELETDVYTAELYAVIGETNFKLILTMYTIPAEPVEPTVVVVENATVEVTEQEVFGNVYTSLMVTGEWSDGETTYPVLVEIGSCDLTKAESEVDASVTVGSMGENAAWLGFADGLLTMTIADNVLTLKGVVENTWTTPQVFIDLTISGKLPAKEEPALPVRAWAYDLNLVVEGDQYNFSYTASTAAKATLLLLDEAGAEVKSVDLGDVKPGKNTAVLAATEIPVAKKCTWAVKLEGAAVAELVEITDASKGIYNYYLPQDVAVDNNPYSATFGQIYVIGMDGASDGGSDRAKTQKRGVFVYNQHLDELNPTNVGYLPANAAPLMTDVSRQAVHRMAVNPVTNHVAFAYNVEGASAIWSMNPANMAGDAVNLIEGLAITKANALCFDEKGVLYVMDNANTSDGGKIVKVVDGELVTVAQNAIWGVQDISLVSDGRGGLWVAQNRWQVDAYAVLSHVNAEGVVDFKVTGESPEEVKALFPNDANASYRGQCAYYAEEDILAFGGNKVVTLFQVTYNDTTGVPAIAKILSTPALGGNIDGVAFDYAGDLYVVSASSERFYKFAVPTTNNAYTVAANHTIYIPEPTVLNPFAYALSSVLSEDATMLTVNYSLNANAKAVDLVILDGDSVLNTIACDGIYKGSYTVNVPTAELPTGVELTWKVVVTGTSVTAPVENPVNYSLYHPSAVDIDNNPENPTFGLILTNEGMQKVKNVTGYLSSGYGAGIYAFTPDFMPIKNGENPGFNGGVEFTEGRADNASATAYSPRRIRISEDGRIFVTSLNTDGNYLWEVNADNMNEWTPVFKGDTLNAQAELLTADSAFIAAPNAGFDVKGSGENLQLAMYSVNLSGITAAAMGGFRLHEYNLGTATEWTTAPSKALVEGKYAINYTGTQVEYDNEGGLWIASYRGTASDANPGIVHINAQGVEDAKLVWNNVRQAGIRFNKDFTKLVVAGNNGSAKKATVYTISKDANGAPVLTEELVINMATVGNNLNDFAWDYAGNLYSCGNSSEKIVSWALPYSGVVATPAAAKYAFQIEEPEPSYVVYEEEITNLVIDYDNMLLIGGPSDALLVEVMLGLGDYNRNDDTYQLKPESYVGIQGADATFVEGYASVDGIDQTAEAVVRCVWNGMNIELHLTMSAAALETVVVVVEDAVLEIEKYLLFGDMYDYALKMTGVWKDSTGVEYPVLVEVPVYYPEATEPYEMYSTVTVGGKGDEDPWLGFGEGYLTITPEGEKITATGVVENPMAGIAIDITISGNLPGTDVDNIPVTVKAVKVVKNGQLVIIKGDVEYNAQGAVIK